MKYTGIYCESLADEEERLDKEMEDEIYEKIKDTIKYVSNIESLLGKGRSKEVLKAVIIYLTEQL